MFLFLFTVLHDEIYVGNWTMELRNGTETLNITDTSRVKSVFKPITPVPGIDGVYQKVVFSNTSRTKFVSRDFVFYGIRYNNRSSLISFMIRPQVFTSPNQAIIFLNEIIENNTLTEPYDQRLIHELIRKQFAYMSRILEIATISGSFDVSDRPKTNTFISVEQFNATVMLPSTQINITSNKFDEEKFIIEGKIFGVLAGFSVIFTAVAWYSVTNINSNLALSSMSFHSYILSMGFDFSFTMFLFDVSMMSSEFQLLFGFLFFCMLILYFFLQINNISKIWRAGHPDINDAPMEELRSIFLKFFAEMTILMSISSICLSLVFDAPIIGLGFLYSSMIPQIIHNAMNNAGTPKTDTFIISDTISRLILLCYFCFYRRNIAVSYSISTGVVTSVWLLLQSTILVLQNHLGGGFFIPKRFLPKPFDYTSEVPEPGTTCSICLTEIEDGEEFMTTPCHHSFHRECLEQWMERDMICPLCRASLPLHDDPSSVL